MKKVICIAIALLLIIVLAEKKEVPTDISHVMAEKYNVSPKMVEVAVKELGVTKEEAENIFWRCSALECDPGFGIKMLNPTLSDEEVERIVIEGSK